MQLWTITEAGFNQFPLLKDLLAFLAERREQCGMCVIRQGQCS